jgi:hypothetical protein
MKHIALISLIVAALLAPPVARAGEASEWTFDVSLYGLAAGMSGEIGVGPVNADVDVGFDKIWDNLEFAAMGKIRVGYGPWAINTDVVYMGLGLSGQRDLSVDLDQWMVEPSISYRVSKYFEPFAGARYNNISAEISGPNLERPGPGILPGPGITEGPGIRSGTQDWWDPIIGANLTLPLGSGFSFNVRGDIGGFGVGSDLTWQAFPYFGWQFAKWASLEAGYRWVSMDYETGSGDSRFKYDMLLQGPQIGLTFHF